MTNVEPGAAAFLLLRAAALLVLWIVGDKDSRGWRLGIVVQVGLLMWALATGSAALVPITVLSIAIHVRNLWHWSRPEGRPLVLRLESELAEAVERYADLSRRYEEHVESDGNVRHERAQYARRLSTYAHELRELALTAGLDFPPMPEVPREEA